MMGERPLNMEVSCGQLEMDKSTLFKCTLCNFSTQYKPNLLRHIQLKHQPFQVFRCDFCNFNATNAIHLNMHKLECPANQELASNSFNYDEEEAPTKEILNAFVKADSNPHIGYINNAKDKPLRLRTHHCSHCDFSTIDSKEFLIHRIQIHGEALTIYECEYCSYATDSPGNIKRHTFVHQRYNNPKKTDDGPSYLGVNNLGMQASVAHVTIEPQVSQHNSPAKSNPRSNPISPEQSAANAVGSLNNNPTLCIYCKFQGKSRSELIEHNRAQHPDKKLYQCSECKFNTQQKPEFFKHCAEHKNLHKKCKICQFTSPFLYNVIRHMRSHHPEYSVDVDDFVDDNDMMNELEDELLYEDEVEDSEVNLSENACHICGYKVSAKEDMDKHIELVHPEEIGGKTNNLLKRFMESVSDEAPSPKKKKMSPKFKCTYCVFVTSNEEEFQEHMAEHSRLNGSCCSVCTFSSLDIMEVQNHIDTAKIADPDHQVAEVYIMDNDPLDEFSTKKKKYKASQDDFSKDKLFFCSHCDFNNVEKRSVISHLGIHANLTPFFCNCCGYSSNWQHTIISHIKSKHGPYVDKHLYHRITYDVENHQITLTGVFPEGAPTRGRGSTCQENGPFRCNICPYETGRFAYLRKHEQHHKKKPEFKFQCSYCPFYASLANTVQQHELLHSESKQQQPDKKTIYKCDHCPYTTQESQNYLYHRQFHRPNKEANFSCKYCTFWAMDRAHLAHHVGLHASEAQSYNISEDDSDVIVLETDIQDPEPSNISPTPSSSTNDNSIAKIRINESFKYFKYICLRCPAIFKSNSNLEVHTKFHGSNLPFPCSHCDYCAKSAIYIKKHQFVHSAAYAHRRKAVVNYLKHKNELSPDVTRNEVHYATKSFLTYENVSHEQPPELRFQMESRAFDQMLLLEENETKSLIAGNFPRPNQSFKSCKLCPAIFCNQSVFVHHFSLHNSAGKYGCFQCSYATDSKVNLETHLQLHSVKMRRELSKAFRFCHKCPSMFLKPAELEDHMKTHQGDDPVSSRHNQDEVMVPQPMTPKKMHHKKRMGLSRSSEKRLTTPRTLNLSSKLYGCELCPFYNDRPEKLNHHQPHHQATSDGTTCYHCNYKIPPNSSLKEHLVIHYQSRSWATPSAFLHYGDIKIKMVENGSKDTVFDSRAYKERIEKEKELLDAQAGQISKIATILSNEDVSQQDETLLPGAKDKENDGELQINIQASPTFQAIENNASLVGGILNPPKTSDPHLRVQGKDKDSINVPMEVSEDLQIHIQEEELPSPEERGSGDLQISIPDEEEIEENAVAQISIPEKEMSEEIEVSLISIPEKEMSEEIEVPRISIPEKEMSKEIEVPRINIPEEEMSEEIEVPRISIPEKEMSEEIEVPQISILEKEIEVTRLSIPEEEMSEEIEVPRISIPEEEMTEEMEFPQLSIPENEPSKPEEKENGDIQKTSQGGILQTCKKETSSVTNDMANLCCGGTTEQNDFEMVPMEGIESGHNKEKMKVDILNTIEGTVESSANEIALNEIEAIDQATVVLSETLANVVEQCDDGEMEVTVVWDEAQQVYKIVDSAFDNALVLVREVSEDECIDREDCQVEGIQHVIEIKDDDIVVDTKLCHQPQEVIEIKDDDGLREHQTTNQVIVIRDDEEGQQHAIDIQDDAKQHLQSQEVIEIKDDEAVVDTLEELAKIIEENQATNLEALQKLEERRTEEKLPGSDASIHDSKIIEERSHTTDEVSDILSFLTSQTEEQQSAHLASESSLISSKDKSGDPERREEAARLLNGGGGGHIDVLN